MERCLMIKLTNCSSRRKHCVLLNVYTYLDLSYTLSKTTKPLPLILSIFYVPTNYCSRFLPFSLLFWKKIFTVVVRGKQRKLLLSFHLLKHFDFLTYPRTLMFVFIFWLLHTSKLFVYCLFHAYFNIINK